MPRRSVLAKDPAAPPPGPARTVGGLVLVRTDHDRLRRLGRRPVVGRGMFVSDIHRRRLAHGRTPPRHLGLPRFRRQGRRGGRRGFDMGRLRTLPDCTLVVVFVEGLGNAPRQNAAGGLCLGDARVLRITSLELWLLIRLRLGSTLAIAAVAPAATAAAPAPTAFAVTPCLALAPLASLVMGVGLERGFALACGCSDGGGLLSRKTALAAFAATAAAPAAPAVVTIAGALPVRLLGPLFVHRHLLLSLPLPLFLRLLAPLAP